MKKELLTRRMKVVYQNSIYGCGIAAIKMIFDYYKRDISLEDIEKNIKVCESGISAKEIIRYAKKYNFIAKGIRGPISEIVKIKVPLILFLKYNHYVVYTGMVSGKIWLIDPSEGRKKVTLSEFEKIFGGIALIIFPESSVHDKKKSSSKGFIMYWYEFFLLSILLMILTGVQLFIDLIIKASENMYLRYELLTMIALPFLFWGMRKIIVQKALNSNIVQKSVIYKEKLFGIPIVYFLFDRLGVKRKVLNGLILYAIVNLTCLCSIFVLNIFEYKSLFRCAFLLLCDSFVFLCIYNYYKLIWYRDEKNKNFKIRVFLIHNLLKLKSMKNFVFFEMFILIIYFLIFLILLIMSRLIWFDYHFIIQVIINIVLIVETTFIFLYIRKCKTCAIEILI